MYWYFKALKQYAVLSGRARRREYWMFTLINSLIIFTLIALWAVSSRDAPVPDSNSLIGDAVWVYGWIIFLPSWAVQVRRLHDVGQSGWWAFLPFAYAALSLVDFSPMSVGGVFVLIYFAFSSIAFVFGVHLIVLSVQESQFGENRYGPNPNGDEL